MAHGPEFLTELIRTALGRSRSNPEDAVRPDNAFRDAPDVLNSSEVILEAGSEDVAHSGPEFDPGIICVLSEKVLLSWLRNRYQLLFPFALDLRRLDERQAELLVHAMIAAAQADGSFDGQERKRIQGTLSLVDPEEDERAFFETLINHPKSLNEILRNVHDVQTGALVYAASLMAVDQRKPVNRYYLKYLAARLQLSEELAGSLEQRYRSSG